VKNGGVSRPPEKTVDPYVGKSAGIVLLRMVRDRLKSGLAPAGHRVCNCKYLIHHPYWRTVVVYRYRALGERQE